MRHTPIFRYTRFLMCLQLLAFVMTATGCDMIYRLLQKEGAEERDIIGEVTAFEPNPKVYEAQQLLDLYGYHVGKPDGILGVHTRNAIAKFQQDNQMKPSRFLDRATWKKLHFFEDYGLVEDGKLNIVVLQQDLRAAGFDPGSIDGVMGDRTVEAVKAFQKASDLAPDGRPGWRTLRALVEYLQSIP